MKNLKESKAITLIALIITIIVLLILAGVVINMTLGNNGIVEKAQGSVNSYDKSAALEEMELKVSKIYMEYYAEEQHRPTLQNISDKLYKDETVEYIKLGKEIASKEKIAVTGYSSIIVKLNAYVYEFEVTENGEVSFYEKKTSVNLNKTGDQYAGTIITGTYTVVDFDGKIDLTGNSKWLLSTQDTAITDSTKYVGNLSGSITDAENINLGAVNTVGGPYHLHIMLVDKDDLTKVKYLVSKNTVKINTPPLTADTIVTAGNISQYLGKEIISTGEGSYSSGFQTWEILYIGKIDPDTENNRIYLITKGSPETYQLENMDDISNRTKWISYLNDNFAEYVLGGMTADLYNTVRDTLGTTSGNPLSSGNPYPLNNEGRSAQAYVFTSTTSYLIVATKENSRWELKSDTGYYSVGWTHYLRPMAVLKVGVSLQQVDATHYKLIPPQN